ncbi:MAG TPA: hypothetical protein VFG55_00185 [Rhodanobacteraceae bacterium]|nr:hypothetical protein [Rhodanobacteraceae bacterium]
MAAGHDRGFGDRQRDVAVTGLMQKPLSKRLKTTGGNDNAMPLLQMRLQLLKTGSHKDRLGASEDILDMILSEEGKISRRPTKRRRPHSKANGPLAGSLEQEERTENRSRD